MYAKNSSTSPPSRSPGHEVSEQLLPGATPRLPLVGSLTRFKALKGITHPIKTWGATPSGCAHAPPPYSFLQGKQNTMHPDGMMRAHEYPSILLKNARSNDTADPVSPLQRARARRLLPHSDLANGESHRLGGSSHARSHTKNTTLAQLNPLKG
jgi:hypothetical protein